jgi:hypothetical protein
MAKKVSFESFAWECKCGNVEHGENPPEECEQCWRLNSFNKMPEGIEEEL